MLRSFLPLGFLLFCTAVRLPAAEPVVLFNGRDLTGWRAWLGRPPATMEVPGLARDAQGKYTEVLGYDRDTYGVFSVAMVDGAPTIRISGQITGGLVSPVVRGNYRLRLRYKWGPPPSTGRANSGVAYHVHGEQSARQTWATSHEFQVRVGEAGDYWAQGDVLADIPCKPGAKDPVYAADGSVATFGAPGIRHCEKGALAESPPDQWTQLELVCYGDQSVQLINGREVLRIVKSQRRTEAGPVPLKEGRFMLQSEGGEIFMRDIELTPLTKPPPELVAK